MSQWGGIDARFSGEKITVEQVTAKWLNMPTGSEGGPRAYNNKAGEVWVEGRLRDVNDHGDGVEILAWFVRVCNRTFVDHASIMFEFDYGPRYRYEWKLGTLYKLKGVLDA